jgi:hypothetical protein
LSCLSLAVRFRLQTHYTLSTIHVPLRTRLPLQNVKEELCRELVVEQCPNEANLGYIMKTDLRISPRIVARGVGGTEVAVLAQSALDFHQFTLVIDSCMNYCRRSGVEDVSFTR